MKPSTLWRLGGAMLLTLALGTAGATVSAQQSSKKAPSSKVGVKTDAPGQDQPSQKSAPLSGDGTELRIYTAKHVAADQLATLLTNLYQQGARNDVPLVHVSVDVRANRIIVAAAPAVQKELEALIVRLDVNAPAVENNVQKMVTFSLKGIDDADVLQSALHMLLQNSPNAKFTMISPQSMLLYGDEKTITEVRDLCDLLKGALATSKEQAQFVKPTVQPLQLRLLWLVDGQGKDAEGAPLAGDLQTLVPVLARLGIQHPRVITNSLVNTTAGGVFKSTGKSSFDGGVKLEFSGNARLVEKMPYVTLQLKLTRGSVPDGKPANELAKIETDFQAPFEHFVLLGMTPFDATTAIFVLQVSQPN